MTDAIRLAIIGLGTHGRGIARIALDAGVALAGAADPFAAGADAGTLLGVPIEPPVEVRADLDDLDWTSIDIALVTVRLSPEEVVAIIERLLQHDVDVITLVEDLYDLRGFDPELEERLDAAARRAGRTVLATGVQDAAWAGITLQATALVRDLRSVSLSTHLGVDGYPQDFLEWCGIGVSLEDWASARDVAAETPSVFGAVLPVLARKLGLTISGQTREFEPVTIDEPFVSTTYGRAIPAGEPIGRRDVVTVDTVEGITFSASLVTDAVLGDDHFLLELDAQPRVELRHVLDPGPPAVDATVVNRLGDVIAAPPGLIASVDLPTPFYRHRTA
jgi:4-hydroxy-tetrahydrodipicolinate reductase